MSNDKPAPPQGSVRALAYLAASACAPAPTAEGCAGNCPCPCPRHPGERCGCACVVHPAPALPSAEPGACDDERYNCRSFHRDVCEDGCSCYCHRNAPPSAEPGACGERLILACDLPRGHGGPHWEDERPALRVALAAEREEVERLRKDRSDLLNVTSTDGLLSSEWVMRTAAAEARAEKAEAEVERLCRLWLRSRRGGGAGEEGK